MRVNVSLKCPHCGTEIKELGKTNPTDEFFELGSVVVCGNCGGVSQIELGGLIEFLDFESLSEVEQKDLKFAIRAVKANAERHRIK